MLKSICIALLLVAAGQVSAATATVALSWTIPTTRANGDPLPVSELKGYEITYTVDGGASVTVPVSGGATTSTQITLMLASRAAPYNTVWTIKAVDTASVKSDPSKAATAALTVPVGPPGTPSSFSLKVSCAGGQCSAVVQ